MQNPAILYPVFTLAGWTFLILLLIPFYRVRAGLRREIKTDDFKYGESASVPPYVSIPNRNYMNLLELPMLFYVACILMYVSAGGSLLVIKLAWVYVILRIVHSIIHLSYNNVMHRLAVFATSNFVLVALWIVAGMHVASYS
ncbi:MAG: MAPEG family protein [Arenimonas sp.]